MSAVCSVHCVLDGGSRRGMQSVQASDGMSCLADGYVYAGLFPECGFGQRVCENGVSRHSSYSDAVLCHLSCWPGTGSFRSGIHGCHRYNGGHSHDLIHTYGLAPSA